MAVDRQLLELYQRVRGDYLEFAKRCLKVRNKVGNNVPLVLNDGQLLLHEKIEKQRARTGKVRMLVPKSRQVGVSTYVGARYYHNTSMNQGRNTYILAHEQSASETLFGMVDRYQKNNPFAPHVGASNARELIFDQLDSSYAVATAGSKAGGRGKAMNNFHGSEVAFWPNAKDHFAASVQTVPDMDGTEIILESTANGVTGEFYERVQDAIQGKGDYEYAFIPWYLMAEYSRRVPDGFEISDEDDGSLFTEREYMELFNLTVEQMVWRRNKIFEIRSAELFDQEYPASVELAFQQKVEGAYHDANKISRARKRKDVISAGPLILGVDPAGEGGDRFAIAFRRGYVVEQVLWRDKIDHLEAVAWLKSIIDEYDPAVVFIDAGGIGKPVITTLRGMGARYQLPHVRGVNFGAPSQGKLARPNMPGPKNRRAEMQMRLKEWLELEEGVSLPDIDAIQGDLTNVRIKPTLTNDLQLMSKHDMRKLGLRSPDLADAIGLTFADLIFIREFSERPKTPGFGSSASKNPIVTPTVEETNYYGGSGGWMV